MIQQLLKLKLKLEIILHDLQDVINVE